MNTVFDSAQRLEPIPCARDPDRSVQLSVKWVFSRLEQFVCGLTGHDEMLRFEPARLSLHCSRCGHQSAGWEVRSSRVDAGAIPAGSILGSPSGGHGRVEMDGERDRRHT